MKPKHGLGGVHTELRSQLPNLRREGKLDVNDLLHRHKSAIFLA